MDKEKIPARSDERIIIHFDYDCFYASVFEAKRPALKSLPFAVQQKQIIVTCNYEARRRGLHKLQLIRDAKQLCPDLIIELGEDISRFRDASKELYAFIKDFSWNNKIERLGFDEVWLDVTDIVEYNMETLNRNDLGNSFFQTDRNDPTTGFPYNASAFAGHLYPSDHIQDPDRDAIDELTLRLRLGSHLALHIRHQLEEVKGYTSTVGIATSKLLSKLVGNLNKPKGQTTLMPPYTSLDESSSNVTKFLDEHDIGKIPGIGFKTAQKLRELVLRRPPDFDAGLVYGGTKETVTVADVRNHAEVNPGMLEKLLKGPGSPHGIGRKIWCLIHGVDDTNVSPARAVPRQISIEDSYIRLDTMAEVLRQLTSLAQSLLSRMRIDLLGSLDEFEAANENSGGGEEESSNATDIVTAGKQWLARPKTLRLTTRPRKALQSDGTRLRSFKRMSHSAPLPNFVFNLNDDLGALAAKLVKETLTPMFHHLHPQRQGWNLSLVNVAVTHMHERAGNSKTASGRDIGNMFKRQEHVLKDFKVTVRGDSGPPAQKDTRPRKKKSVRFVDTPMSVDPDPVVEEPAVFTYESAMDTENVVREQEEDEDFHKWDDGTGEDDMEEVCRVCGLRLLEFAMIQHRRSHEVAIGSEDSLVPD